MIRAEFQLSGEMNRRDSHAEIPGLDVQLEAQGMWFSNKPTNGEDGLERKWPINDIVVIELATYAAVYSNLLKRNLNAGCPAPVENQASGYLPERRWLKVINRSASKPLSLGQRPYHASLHLPPSPPRHKSARAKSSGQVPACSLRVYGFPLFVYK